MNSFNRLLLLYTVLFLIEKYYIIIIERNAQILCFQKKCLYLQYRKKQLKLTIMGKETKTSEKRNFRITIIFKDEIMTEKFQNEYIAKDTIRKMKELFPNMFIGGALEEKCKSWRVIWALGNN
jgi:hypothetical protein